MTVLSVSRPVYADPDNTSIRCLVTLDSDPGEHPYLASNSDPVSAALFQQIVQGQHGEIAAYAPPPVDLAALKARAGAAISGYADAVINQVAPTASRLAAFQSVAGILAASGGAAPTSGPYADTFAALAASYGVSPVAFANLVLTTQNASLRIETQRSTAAGAVAAASNPAQIAAAITAFSSALASVIGDVNASSTTPISPPPAISVPGVTQ